jgi:glycosyltransferase involved in cell wall biosynthesis
VVIYNGVDLGELPDHPADLAEPPLLCFAGRFEHQKGIDLLLDSLERLMAADPAFRVAIYGEGSYGGAVAAASARRPERIVVNSPIADLRARLATFHAILMPSRFEGLSLLAVEALCSGVPVLATRATGLDEVLPPGYPGRCPAGDPGAYSEVIRDFLQNRDAWRVHATKARVVARERFSLKTMIAAYDRLYRVALAPPAPTARSTVDRQARLPTAQQHGHAE